MAFIKIIKNNRPNNVIAWKYPNDELNTLSQLIVNEYEEAILFKEGQALDLFTAGRYTLDTPNIPILNKIINLPFGFESPYKAQVWFVNKVDTLDIKWGTRTPIQIQDPKYSILVPIRAFGQFGLRVDNSKKFLIKLVGKVDEFDVENIRNYFRGLYLTKVKDSISSYLVKKGISITEINAYLDELSDYIRDRMDPVFEEYGIKLASFYVNDISIPEDDPAVIKLKDALAKKAEMDIIGYDYQQERSFNTMENISKNEGGSSNFMNIGMGLAAGAKFGKNIGESMNNITNNLNTEHKIIKFCPDCGNKLNGTETFCSSCGKKIVNTCPKCGSEVNDNQNFCSNCGTKL